MAAYTDNIEHLRDELARLDLLLEREVARFRHGVKERAEAPFAGLYISDAEVDDILAGPAPLNGPGHDLDARIEALALDIQNRTTESRNAGVPLRLLHLADTFGLSRLEMDLVVLAFACEFDLRYQKLFAYVQDDINRKRPTVELALRLFCADETERVACRRVFSDLEPLFAVPLMTRCEDPAERPAPLLGHSLKLEERIAEFLVGGDYMESRFAVRPNDVRWVIATKRLSDLVLNDEPRQALERLAVGAGDRRWTCILEGPAGGGKKAAAEAVCAELGMPLLVVAVPAIARGEAETRSALRAVLREARLYGGAVFLDGWPDASGEDPSTAALKALLLDEIARFPGPIFIGSRTRWAQQERPRRALISIRLPMPDDRQRVELWHTTLGRLAAERDAVDVDYLAGTFRFTAGRIAAAVEVAITAAQIRREPVSHDDLLAGCRAESAKHIISFAKKLKPRRRWNDLVLPGDVGMQLREFCRQVRQRTKVYGEWGFDRKLSSGKGTIAMFTGTSGTGKTLSAEVMATELGLDLFRVDLSSVISKYIGETEKNLDRVFHDAQDSNAILFFDEADALFGKRSEVKDAHDRYANIEINYLLQRVEEYEGVIILATNMSKNIDQAFLRRLHFAIEFPFPDEHHRQLIWERIFPANVPLAGDVDFEFLGRQFKIAGGNIKNVALAAAFHAADDGNEVRMEHLVLAMKREYQKLGKTCERTDFEHYYELVR